VDNITAMCLSKTSQLLLMSTAQKSYNHF